jgi:hypothetical protein
MWAGENTAKTGLERIGGICSIDDDVFLSPLGGGV